MNESTKISSDNSLILNSNTPQEDLSDDSSDDYLTGKEETDKEETDKEETDEESSDDDSQQYEEGKDEEEKDEEEKDEEEKDEEGKDEEENYEEENDEEESDKSSEDEDTGSESDNESIKKYEKIKDSDSGDSDSGDSDSEDSDLDKSLDFSEKESAINETVDNLTQEQLDDLYNEIMNDYNEDDEDDEESEDDNDFLTKYDNYNEQMNDYNDKLELMNRENIKITDSYDSLYPCKDDPDFSLKIAQKKEFNESRYDGKINDVKEAAEILCNTTFELAPHQIFSKNFMSINTPYNSLLLYHGLGSGKTCSAIGVAEEMRDYFKKIGITSKILIIASPKVQKNFELQLFDANKLKNKDGIWTINDCIGDKLIREINPMNSKNMPLELLVKNIKNLIKESYQFMGYIEFANVINKIINKSSDLKQRKQKESIQDNLRKEFNNKLVIIDEIHNIRTSNKEDKLVLNAIDKLVENVNEMRLLLLSATPMYNTCREIVWLINLMNKNDNRSTIIENDIFTSSNDLKITKGREVGKELLERKVIGNISFVRGENPYTFPYRIWPSMFSPENTFENKTKPRRQYNGKKLLTDLQFVDVYLTELSEYQEEVYNNLISSTDDVDDAENDVTGYNILKKSLDALTMTYPMMEDSDGDYKNRIGKDGLEQVVKKRQEKCSLLFEYISDERVFAPENIGKYSSKIKSICDSIMSSEGIILIYSQYIDGGLIPVALALEELGFTRAGKSKSLFRKAHVKPNSYKYIMITGQKDTLTKNFENDLELATSSDNFDGSQVKVILITQAGAEGLDFKCIRQVHVLEPWYNMNRIEQIIGRGVRTCSHKLLPFEKRNVQIFLHGSILKTNTEIEASDMYIYRLAETKAIQIGNVTRLLKQTAVDCLLNNEQMNFSEEMMNQTVNLELSTGENIEYKVGDKPFTSICDYMEKCNFVCKNANKFDKKKTNDDTYNDSHLRINIETIIKRIKTLYKEKYYYNKLDLVASVNIKKSYPIIEINEALNELVENKNEYITDRYGRLGNLVNIDEYYLFQPIELGKQRLSLHDRSKPIDYKHSSISIQPPKTIKEYKFKKYKKEYGSKKNEVYDKKSQMFKINKTDKKDVLEKITKLPKDKLQGKESLDEESSDESSDTTSSDSDTTTSDSDDENSIDSSDKQSKILERLEANYNAGVSMPKKIARGEQNEYIHFGIAMKKLLDIGMEMEYLINFFTEHIIDKESYDNKLILLNYLESKNKEEFTEFEKSAKEYFKNITKTTSKLYGIFLENDAEDDKFVLVIRDKEQRKWNPATPIEFSKFKDKIEKITNKFLPISENLGNIIGFVTKNSESKPYLIFKTKLQNGNKNTGSVCTSKKIVLGHVLEMHGKTELGKNINFSSFYLNVLEYTLELLLKYCNKNKINNKYWFINSANSAIIDLIKA